MSGLELETKEILERFVPEPVGAHGDWDAVVADACVPQLRWPVAKTAAAAAAFAVALAATLAWPFGGGSGGILDRAIAATGDGPVLHVVLEIQPDGYIVDLASGRRTRPKVVFEQWYERGSELRERVIRSTGGAADPVGVLTKRPDWGSDYSSFLAGFVAGYRDALRRGDAAIFDHGTVAGRAVAWVRFTHGPPVGATYDVAVDEKTGEPVFLRMSEGRSDGHYAARVLELDSVADLPRGSEESTSARIFRAERKGNISPAQARVAMSRPALWLGPSFRDLPLSRTTLLEFAQAPGPVWNDSTPKEAWTGLDLVYGGTNGKPSPTARFVEIEEQTREGVREGAPAEGSVLIQGERDGAGGLLQKDGVYMLITGSSPDVILEAARALEPIG